KVRLSYQRSHGPLFAPYVRRGPGSAAPRESGYQESPMMAQILTAIALLGLAAFLYWRYEGLAQRHETAGSAASDPTFNRERFPRPIHRASANEFLHVAADLTFGFVVLALGFFLLMWMIATA